MSGKARVVYYLVALMDVVRLFPGQIPDLEIVAQTSE